MNNEEIDNLFKSRLSNYESKTHIDNDALWAKINNNIVEPKQGFMRMTSRRWIMGAIGIVFLAVSVYFIYSCFLKSDNQASMQINKGAGSHSDQYLRVNPAVSNTVVVQNKKANNDAIKKIEMLPANQHELSTKPKASPELNISDAKPNQNQASEMSMSAKVQAENKTIEADTLLQTVEIQQTAKRITVVKKHVIQTDTVIKVRRVRK